MKKIQIGIDEMDNGIHTFLELLAMQALEWNIEPIANIREEVEDALKLHGIEIEYIDDSLCGDGKAMEFND